MSAKKIIGDPMIINGKVLPLSKAVRASGDFIFLSGQLPMKDGKLVSDDIRVQARQVIENVRAIARSAGGDLKDIVKCTIWLAESSDFQAFNEVYAEYFPTEPPARSCVTAGFVVPGAKVEIEAILLAAS